jgi:hypothetical protein
MFGGTAALDRKGARKTGRPFLYARCLTRGAASVGHISNNEFFAVNEQTQSGSPDGRMRQPRNS